LLAAEITKERQFSMKCPHCNVAINVEWEDTGAYADSNNSTVGTEVSVGTCPDCEKLIVKLVHGTIVHSEYTESISEVKSEEIIYPKFSLRSVESEVPEPYKSEFLEATAILNISPKASAALSRRMLQNILHKQFSIEKRSLADEIDEFIHMQGVPSHLAGAIDAIRNIGNFGAHPLKDLHSGEIVDVEPGEAEWLLDVLESLFDFTFVQPKRLDERKKKLNAKLQQLGKPPMKE
jgi:hypothetical protein